MPRRAPRRAERKPSRFATNATKLPWPLGRRSSERRVGSATCLRPSACTGRLCVLRRAVWSGAVSRGRGCAARGRVVRRRRS
eukprot:6179752-Pleurochrysis_carterae.AAC.1